MPLYEYTCQDCGKRFDLMRSMKDADAPAICKHCHGEHTRRKLSVFYAASDGRSTTPAAGGGCAGCGGGSCASCGH